MKTSNHSKEKKHKYRRCRLFITILSNYHLQNNTFLSAACTAGSWEMFRLIAGQ